MQMILNELSAKFPASTVEEGKQIMQEFVDTFQSVKKVIHNEQILLDQNYNSFELAPKYQIEQWRNDPAVDVEIKRGFRTLLNKSAVYNSEEFELYCESDFLTECLGKQYSSKGCLLVHTLNGVAISFLSDDQWKEAMIQGNYLQLEENGDIKASKVQIPNVSNKQNIECFQEYYRQQEKEYRYTRIVSGQDILDSAKEIFPNLVFCDHAVQGCRKDVGVSEAGQVYRRLLELQYAAKEMEKGFDKDALTYATPESKETLKRFEEEHTFQLPNGKSQVFSWHVRYTGGYAGRIFFHPIAKEKKFYIGHIGHKLPTVQYN